MEPKALALHLLAVASAPDPAVAGGGHAIEGVDTLMTKGGGEAKEVDEAMLDAIEGVITAAAGGIIPGEAPASAKDEEEDLGIGMTAATYNLWSRDDSHPQSAPAWSQWSRRRLMLSKS
ncbi:unnamed protein product [Rhizoctonia solani]|uniref:Uncharacterized protein n=1 Tax=Rhizoctonia solani TaxID=456999 RepID=A0A8H3CBC1_9AGAM|nr:unnamed protein product [Rhizoctonia solani]